MKKILIVDDNPTFVIPVKSALKINGFQVITALNGREGLASAKEERPDLVVLDIMMPEENGLLTLKKLHEDKTTENIPIIISTNLEASYALIKEKNVAGFVLKSKSNIMELVDKIKKILKVE